MRYLPVPQLCMCVCVCGTDVKPPARSAAAAVHPGGGKKKSCRGGNWDGGRLPPAATTVWCIEIIATYTGAKLCHLDIQP